MFPSAYDLGYFVQIADCQNLSRAAVRLGITQPSLTTAMQRLEEAVGVPLLVRHKTGVTLTPAGKQLLHDSRELLQLWERVKTNTVASHDEVLGTYRVGCHPAVAAYSLPQVLPGLLEEFPRLEIHLVHGLSRTITDQVANLELDMGIVVNPTRHADLVIKKLCDDAFTLWVGPGQRAVQDPTSPHAVLIADPELTQVRSLQKKLRQGPYTFARVLATASLEVAAELTAAGAGIGVLPGRVAQRPPFALTKLAEAPVYPDEVALIYRHESRQLGVVRIVAERLMAVFHPTPTSVA